MNVLLVKPPIRGFVHEIGRHYPIGLTYLASAIRRAGHTAAIFDALADSNENRVVAEADYTERDRLKVQSHPRWSHLLTWGSPPEAIELAMVDHRPDVVGISCMFSPFYETAYEAADLAKRVVPDAVVVMGGQHPTVAPLRVLQQCASVDILVLGEGEQTLPNLLRSLEQGEELTHLEGLAFRCGHGYCRCAVRTPNGVHINSRKTFADLSELAPPADDLVNARDYDGFVTLITSRGCPFSCSFCTVHAVVGKKFRHRTSKDVVDEIERYVASGVSRFAIEDDNFTFSMPRVIEICEEIIRRDLKVWLSLPNGMTVVKLDEGVADLMARAGFRSLFLGLESTDEDRLREIDKRFTSLALVRRGYRWLADRGVDVAASLIVGLPGQSIGEIARDIGRLLAMDIRFWSNPFYPIPGSPDFQTCIAQSLITESTDYVLFDQYNFATPTSTLTKDELYFAWVLTQTISHWPDYFRAVLSEGAGALPAQDAAQMLVGHAMAARAADPDLKLECPAEPCGSYVYGDVLHVAVREETCFAIANRIHDYSCHIELNRYTADVVAAALSVACRSWFTADILPCPPHGEPAAGQIHMRVRQQPLPPLFGEFFDELVSCFREVRLAHERDPAAFVVHRSAAQDLQSTER